MLLAKMSSDGYSNYMKTQKERMISGDMYLIDNELKEDIYACRRKIRDFNNSITRDEIQAKARELFGTFGDNSSVTPPFRCDYGYNIHIGNNVYFNYNTSILDVVPVHIGDNVLVGPDCGFYPAEHPIDPEIRNTGLEFGKPIIIEKDVWIRGHVVIKGGVTIGEGSVVAAGSVVTKDVPAHVVVGGNPAKIIREITDSDHEKWMEIYNNFKEEVDMDNRDFL